MNEKSLWHPGRIGVKLWTHKDCERNKLRRQELHRGRREVNNISPFETLVDRRETIGTRRDGIYTLNFFRAQDIAQRSNASSKWNTALNLDKSKA